MKYILVLILLICGVTTNVCEENIDEVINSEMKISTESNSIVNIKAIMYSNGITNVRKRATQTSEKIGFYRKSDTVTVTGYTEGWYEVDFNGYRGYVEENCLVVESPNDVVQYVDFTYTIGYVPNYYTDDVLYEYEKLPTALKEHFEEDGSRLIITERDLGTRIYSEENNDILGVTRYYGVLGYADIYITYSQEGKSSIYHEFGHYLDGELNDISETEEFINIWNEEMVYLYLIDETNVLNINTPSEYFAESFGYYINHPNELKFSCPKTYNFLVGCLNEL